MEKNKMHKLDLFFYSGIGMIAIFSALIDILNNIGFPVYSCMSIYATYALWFIILIYSTVKYKEKQERPQCVSLFMFFCLPFLHIAFIMFGLIGGNMLMNLFNL